MMDRLRSAVGWIEHHVTAASEGETDRDGPLSTGDEWHAALVGAALGVMTGAAAAMEPALGAAMLALSVGLVQIALGRDPPADMDPPEDVERPVRRESIHFIVAWCLGFLPFVLAVMA